MTVIDAEVTRVNASAPTGERRRLAKVEPSARAGLKNLNWTLATELRLPAFDDPREILWPLQQATMAQAYIAATAMAPLDTFDASRWPEYLEARDAARAEEWQRTVASATEWQRRRQEREAAEEQARLAAHGPTLPYHIQQQVEQERLDAEARQRLDAERDRRS
jgi:hypothetical protein